MHPIFARKCKAEVRSKLIPREVRLIDGRAINSRLITQEVIVNLQVGNHEEKLVADITNTGRYACILGTPWLSRHDPTIRWSRNEVIFDSEYCQATCVKRLLQSGACVESHNSVDGNTCVEGQTNDNSKTRKSWALKDRTNCGSVVSEIVPEKDGFPQLEDSLKLDGEEKVPVTHLPRKKLNSVTTLKHAIVSAAAFKLLA